MNANDVFEQHEQNTERVINQLLIGLEAALGNPTVSIGEHTCIYVTGSCGRLEMGAGSDLDAYIVRVDDEDSDRDDQKLQNAILSANAAAGLPELDANGGYLKPVSRRAMLELLGGPTDDSEGVLTKRMLLLLESRPLLGQVAHRRLVEEVISAYWQNEDLHPNDYLPFVLVNDIVRYWRIVLLNHESKLREIGTRLRARTDLPPPEREVQLLAERRYRSYKLRFPRCLTCFSALLYLLAITRSDPAHVCRDDVREMVSMTPIERLQHIAGLAPDVQKLIDELFLLYATYLQRSDGGKHALLEALQRDTDVQTDVPREGRRFTELVFELVQKLGVGRPLHRHMVV